jgi:hypothetical protein
MTDDEVKQWLSDDERRMWAQTSVKPWARHVFTQLAETRKALASAEWAATEDAGRMSVCPICRTYEGEEHTVTCILATMPRPR